MTITVTPAPLQAMASLGPHRVKADGRWWMYSNTVGFNTSRSKSPPLLHPQHLQPSQTNITTSLAPRKAGSSTTTSGTQGDRPSASTGRTSTPQGRCACVCMRHMLMSVGQEAAASFELFNGKYTGMGRLGHRMAFDQGCQTYGPGAKRVPQVSSPAVNLIRWFVPSERIDSAYCNDSDDLAGCEYCGFSDGVLSVSSSAVITTINNDEVWFKRLDGTKSKLYISQLQKGKYTIKHS